MEKFKKYQEFDFNKTQFTGYESLNERATVIGLFDKEANMVTRLKGHGFVIFNRTPLYAMAGGQASDQGRLILNNHEITLLDLRKDIVYGYFIHEIDTNQVELKVKDEIVIEVNEQYRSYSSINHSALHITWQTILNLVGKYVKELGSKLDNEKYQLQFEVDELITEEIALQASEIVNNKVIPEKIDTNVFYVTQQEAIAKNYFYEFTKIAGDEMVRMIEFPGVVIEPCSGTHITNTSEIKQVWFMNYDKNSKRIMIDMTANVAIANQYFTEKLVDRYQELERIIQKGIDQGFNQDLTNYVLRAKELIKIWNYLSIKEMNTIVVEVTTMINKYLKEQERILIENFNNKILSFEIINNKYKIFETFDEMLSNKVLMNKAIKATTEEPNLVNVFINQYENGTNVILIRNKDLDIDLKELNQSIVSTSTLKGGGTNSLIQLNSQSSDDAKKLIELLRQ